MSLRQWGVFCGIVVLIMDTESKVKKLALTLEELYRQHGGELLFHGWHHIYFVWKKAAMFAVSIDADLFLVESAALVHDLNYLVELNSKPEKGRMYRRDVLLANAYTDNEISKIEVIIMEAHTALRGHELSDEAKALSGADTLFKSLPITPILFASNYIKQNDVNVADLAEKITSEQNRLFEEGIYFYTDIAKSKYLKWATANISLWNNVKDCLVDEDVSEMLSIAKELEVI